MTVLKSTPDTVTADQLPAGDLSSTHYNRTVTLLGDDGSMLRGVLILAGGSDTPGHTTLGIRALGTHHILQLPHSAPIHIHHQETR